MLRAPTRLVIHSFALLLLFAVYLRVFSHWHQGTITPSLNNQKQAGLHEYTQPPGTHGNEILYRCPPCGCSEDETLFHEDGNCPSCKMSLVSVNHGIAQKVDQSIAPLFRGGFLGSMYSKLVYPIVAFALLISSYLFISNWNSKHPNLYLNGLVLVISLYAFKNQLYGVHYGLSSNYKCLFVPISFILWIGPLCYMYVQSITDLSNKWKKHILLHLLPGFLVFLAYTMLLISSDYWQQSAMSSPFEIGFSHAEQMVSIIIGIIYLAMARTRIIRWKRKHAIRQVWIFRWLNIFTLSLTIFLTAWACIIGMNYWLYDGQVATMTYNPLWVFMAALLLWLIFVMLSKPKVFLSPNSLNLSNGTPQISFSQLQYLIQKLEKVMESTKLYRDPDLSLSKLARAIDIKPRYLSMLLNQQFKKNFYDFVNHYRVEDVKKSLAKPENKHLTIEAIANQSGFKSKSSFNTAFKKWTALTPSEYIRATTGESK